MPEPKQYQGRILVVDDDADVRALFEARLEAEGFRVQTADSIASLKAIARKYTFDAILLDLWLGEDDALSVLPYLMRETPYTKVIVMTAHGSIDRAVDAMRRGASTFIPKSTDLDKIVDEIKARMRSERRPAAQPAIISPEDLGIAGHNRNLMQLVDVVQRIHDVDTTVLICGESGTGKELIARAVHNLSHRATQRFEAINCGAIPETLLESELFGHKRGAFTDAKADRKGIFELCSEGTLLLDEIGDMPLGLQVKLLRVLQEREVAPLGASRPIKVNTRVVAATNRNLEEEVRKGHFREDLYFRLSVLPITVPPLRERRDDIPVLVNHFLRLYNERFGRQVRPASEEIISRLMAYDWPGNVRELQNAIERAVVLSRDDLLHLEDMIQDREAWKRASVLPLEDANHASLSLTEAKEQFEKTYLTQLLGATKGNISEAARLSGRYRADIYRLMAKYGLQLDDFRA